MRKNNHRPVSFAIAAVLVWMMTAVWCMAAAGASVIPDGQKGSISLAMTSGGDPIGGGAFSVYQVASVEETETGYHYALTDKFRSSTSNATVAQLLTLDEDGYISETLGLDLDSNWDLAEALMEFASASSVSGDFQMNIDSDGNASASGLDLGLYLFDQTSAAAGYRPVTPFLITVPGTNSDGSYNFSVVATPKIEEAAPLGAVVGTTPSIQKIITNKSTGKTATSAPTNVSFDFTFTRLAQTYPLPVNSAGTVDNGGPIVSQNASTGVTQLRVKGAGTVTVGEITFNQPGEYYYLAQEVQGSEDGFEYDKAAYWIKYVVDWSEDQLDLEIKSVEVRKGTPKGTTAAEKAADLAKNGTLQKVSDVSKMTLSFTNPYGNEGGKKNTEGTKSTNPSPSAGTGGSLPQTGQLWWPVWLLAALGALLVLGGALLRKKSK